MIFKEFWTKISNSDLRLLSIAALYLLANN